MKKFGLKICIFLFFVALFSGRTSELLTLTGGHHGDDPVMAAVSEVVADDERSAKACGRGTGGNRR